MNYTNIFKNTYQYKTKKYIIEFIHNISNIFCLHQKIMKKLNNNKNLQKNIIIQKYLSNNIYT